MLIVISIGEDPVKDVTAASDNLLASINSRLEMPILSLVPGREVKVANVAVVYHQFRLASLARLTSKLVWYQLFGRSVRTADFIFFLSLRRAFTAQRIRKPAPCNFGDLRGNRVSELPHRL
ncbi:hypothetical protein CR51_10185 [Caballeronia megalochromosomata]|nr:hypothetical protein CR51_10185 [Caballeronia megalochromosomata]